MICNRLERAQALQNAGYAQSLARHNPESGAQVLDMPGAEGVCFSEGHSMNQGLALGLGAPLPDDDLTKLESLLGRGGHNVVVELTPGAEEGLAARLSQRGFTIRQFQQVWVKYIDPYASMARRADVEVRPVRPDEMALFSRLLFAGFSDAENLPNDMASLPFQPLAVDDNVQWMAFVGGEPAAEPAANDRGELFYRQPIREISAGHGGAHKIDRNFLYAIRLRSWSPGAEATPLITN